MKALKFVLHESSDSSRRNNGGDYDEWAVVVKSDHNLWIRFHSSAEGEIPFCGRCGRYEDESSCRCNEWPEMVSIPSAWGEGVEVDIEDEEGRWTLLASAYSARSER